VLGREAVRATLMRCTLHLATAADFLALRPLMMPVLERAWRGNFGRLVPAEILPELLGRSEAMLAMEPMSAAELGRRLARFWPALDPDALAMASRTLSPLLHVPPAGLWSGGAPPALTPARAWLGEEPRGGLAIDALVLRYLAAFGPASAADFAAWAGLAGGAALARLRPLLLVFRDEAGRELFDLPEAPRPDEDVPAPARLLAAYDNIIIGFADRSRLVPEGRYGALALSNGVFRPCVLLDGQVAGLWRHDSDRRGDRIGIDTFEPLDQRAREALAEEAARYAAFAGSDGAVVEFGLFEGGKRQGPARGDGQGLQASRRSGGRERAVREEE